jgi:hypothetical protein
MLKGFYFHSVTQIFFSKYCAPMQNVCVNTNIPFTLKRAGEVTLDIWDLSGRKMISLPQHFLIFYIENQIIHIDLF